MDGMAQAVAGLEITPDYVLIDGNRCPPGLIQPAEARRQGRRQQCVDCGGVDSGKGQP